MGIWEKQGAPKTGAGKRRLGFALLAGILATAMGWALLPGAGVAATQYPDL